MAQFNEQNDAAFYMTVSSKASPTKTHKIIDSNDGSFREFWNGLEIKPVKKR